MEIKVYKRDRKEMTKEINSTKQGSWRCQSQFTSPRLTECVASHDRLSSVLVDAFARNRKHYERMKEQALLKCVRALEF